jgi:hypothetical protein
MNWLINSVVFLTLHRIYHWWEFITTFWTKYGRCHWNIIRTYNYLQYGLCRYRPSSWQLIVVTGRMGVGGPRHHYLPFWGPCCYRYIIVLFDSIKTRFSVTVGRCSLTTVGMEPAMEEVFERTLSILLDLRSVNLRRFLIDWLIDLRRMCYSVHLAVTIRSIACTIHFI